MRRLDVVALGGNAILPADGAGTIKEQIAVTRSAVTHIVRLLEAGREVVLTHGNGPIVGNIVIRNEAVRSRIAPMPLDVCGADSQGGIGYMIQQTLRNALAEGSVRKEIVALVTQVVVDPEDPAFRNPSKPIGPYYSGAEARRLERERGWVTKSTMNRGYRRVVASPRPIEVVELKVIRSLVDLGVIVVTVGGGGIPVIRRGDSLCGIEAVVDKDLASSLLASELGAERMIILTDVDAVYKNFGTDSATLLRSVCVSEVRVWLNAGEFPEGSMGTKLQAAVEFVESGGSCAVICRPDDLTEAVAGEKGTTIRPDGSDGD